MSEAVARPKFSCPSCGAEAVWNPAKKALACSFCGTNSPANIELAEGGAEKIVEHDLVAALRALPDEARGWQAEKKQVRCQSCNAISVFDATRVGQRCDFCGSSSLLPYEEVKATIRPESLLEFKITEEGAHVILRDWLSRRSFAPGALKRLALTDSVKGLYIPYWTFDAHAISAWVAESGYYYYVEESYTDSNGEKKTRSVQRTRWESSEGYCRKFFDDTLVPGSRGIQAEVLKLIEPFPTVDKLKPYHPGFVAGWTVERYQIDLLAAAGAAQQRMNETMRSVCASDVPGDTYRGLVVKTGYTGQTFKHILVPVWVLVYQFRQKSYQVVINGYTGQVAGRYPKSIFKIAALVIFILMIVALFGWIVRTGGR